MINISHDKDLTHITSQVVEEAVAGEDTKEVDTQEEVNNRSTSEEAQEEAGEGEDGDAVPHRPQGVHDDDLEGPEDTESSSYATL